MKNITFILIGLLIVGMAVYFGKDYIPQLTSSKGEIHVDSEPQTTVFIDGETQEKTSFTKKVDPGQYDIKLLPEDQAALSSWQQTVTVNSGTQTYIKAQLGSSTITSSWEIVTLEKLSGSETEIAISSETDSSEIYFDGEFKGTVPLSFEGVSSGEHEIRLTAPGFAEKKIKAEVFEGYKLSIRTQLALVDESQVKGIDAESQEPTTEKA